jgi:hypothetical protein
MTLEARTSRGPGFFLAEIGLIYPDRQSNPWPCRCVRDIPHIINLAKDIIRSQIIPRRIIYSVY